MNPITTEPIEISVSKPRWDTWKARSHQFNSGKATAESVCGPDSAAHNLACRWFFGRTSGLHEDAQRVKTEELSKDTKNERYTYRGTVQDRQPPAIPDNPA